MLGFLGIIKPSGVSSAKLLNKVKALVKANNKNDAVGHFGTLDPNASGVLVVAIGKATRLFSYFLEKQKTYETVFEFGIETPTLDLESEVTSKTNVLPTKEDIQAILPTFMGKQMQTPPNYSAVKINGECAYNKARNGESFTLKSKEIEIFSIKLVKQLDNSKFKLEVVCSSGTYIRSLAKDMAEKLKSKAIAREIVRTKSGMFNFDNCLRENELSYENITKKILSPIEVLNWIKAFKISNIEFKDLLDGKKISILNDDGNYFVVNENNDIMLVKIEQNQMKILVNLKE